MTANFGTGLDLDEIGRRNVALLREIVMLQVGIQTIAETDGEALWGLILKSLGDVPVLATEVQRLREQLRSIRDVHSPQNSPDPAFQGAVCTGCSVGGSRVAWPCTTWKATEGPS